jgi:hypothetical protein
MGCCFSLFDNVPETPKQIQADPSPTEQCTFVTAKLGYWGFSHDHGIWRDQIPDNSGEKKEQMWMWFRKRQQGSDFKIQLENFTRTDPNDKSMGKVLFYGVMQGKPKVEYFQRVAGRSGGGFFGFFGSGYGNSVNYDDSYYFNHGEHQRGLHNQRVLGKTEVITKWQSYSTTKLFDGNMGRGEGTLNKDFVLMDVIACGTIVTTYTDYEEEEVVRNDKGEETGRRFVRRTTHNSYTFVDFIQYRLTVNNQLWAEWQVLGDSHSNAYSGKNITIDTPFFATVLDGGWFSRTKFRVTPKQGIDPALALLISHIVTSEYSLEEIKNDLNISIPSRPPMSYAAAPMMTTWNLSSTSGTFAW